VSVRVLSLMLWPFAVLAAAIRLLFAPTLLLGLCYLAFWWWHVPHIWWVLVTVLIGGYVVIVARLWARTVVGALRSMARGTVTVRGYGPAAHRRPRSRRRSRRGRRGGGW